MTRLNPHQRIAARQLYRGIARLAREAEIDLRQPGMIRDLVQGRRIRSPASPETLDRLRELLILLGRELGNDAGDDRSPIRLRDGGPSAG